MATPAERLDSYPVPSNEPQEKPVLRVVEEIRLPDGSPQPAWPLALRGLEISLKEKQIDRSQVVEQYKSWDPSYDIYRHLGNM